jgi:asparagine synthase (glutamine-hydrolysing)
MWNESHTVAILFNGEIYNFRELRERHGLTCRTGTDTEVLLQLYERLGLACLQELRGMFALALFEASTGTWHLARDPQGIKPLYLAEAEGRLFFASEARALARALPQRPPVSEAALSCFLRLQYVPSPHTIFTGVRPLAPGTCETWQQGRCVARCSFVTAVEVPSLVHRQEALAYVPQLLEAAVREHLVSDRPIGLFLSGGLDSSILLHHMAAATDRPIQTFTVRFEARDDESSERVNADADLAAQTAAHYGTQHTELLLTAADFCGAYAETVLALDQPNADLVAVAQLLLAKRAKAAGVDVILTGVGGDELFGGYHRYRITTVLSRLRRVPPWLRSTAARLCGQPADVAALDPGPDLWERLVAQSPEVCAPMVRGSWFQPQAVHPYFQAAFEMHQQSDSVRQAMEVDRTTWLIDELLKLADGTTMKASVEGRVPFLDARVIAAMRATPARWHVTERATKTLLREAYQSRLPAHLFRLKKASFYLPLAKWFRREAGRLLDEALETPEIRTLFSLEMLEQYRREHLEHRAYRLHQLHGVVQLAAWLRVNRV